MTRRNFSPTINYYIILGAEPSDSPKVLKKKYRKLAFEFHPDRTGGNADKFKLINESYQVLEKDKDEYDRFLEDLKKPKEKPKPQPKQYSYTPPQPPTPQTTIGGMWADSDYYESIIFNDPDSLYYYNHLKNNENKEKARIAQEEKIRQSKMKQEYFRKMEEQKKEQERMEKERLEQIKRQRDRSVGPWPDYQELANPRYIDDY